LKNQRPVMAVWLDGADRATIEAYVAQGQLPFFKRLKDASAYGKIKYDPQTLVLFESVYYSLLTGCSAETLRHWFTLEYDPVRCGIKEATVDFQQTPPFYAVADRRKVLIFDVPQAPLRPEVNGWQIKGWGAHADDELKGNSLPPGIIEQIVDTFGDSPAFVTDCAELDDPQSLARLSEQLEESIKRRIAIIKELLQRDQWDLVLTCFGEIHLGTHFFWPHPDLNERPGFPNLDDGCRKLYRQVDSALGEIAEVLSEDTTLLLFSSRGMEDNRSDLSTSVILPELMFRYSFPGQVGLDFDPAQLSPSPESQAGIINWVMEVWNYRRRTGEFPLWLRRHLKPTVAVTLERWFRISPTLFQPEGFEVANYSPAVWYSQYWYRMRAFALPSFSWGRVRINVRGRDRYGIVPPSAYEQTCTEIVEWLSELRDLKTGVPAVKEVIRTRSVSELSDSGKPDADLIVHWAPGIRNGFESPRFGKIGPLPYFRAGGHNSDGFAFLRGPGIKAGSKLEEWAINDIAPTILALLGVSIPSHMDGQPLRVE
jgi:predicted AlkP superfamily phosphohydrolase/phosphomutase